MNVLCPALAVTTSLFTSFGIGLATLGVFTGSWVVLSFLKGIPLPLNLFTRVLVISSWVALVQMIFAITYPPLNNALGIYLPLVGVSCVLMEETRCSLKQALEGGLLFMGILMVVGSIRELLGNGTLFALPLFEVSMRVFLQPAGAFMVIGGLLVLQKHWTQHD
ncbi:MAG: Rnf-Nqr domain containing protein [Candidatus Margulisiibacteriota bacterium]